MVSLHVAFSLLLQQQVLGGAPIVPSLRVFDLELGELNAPPPPRQAAANAAVRQRTRGAERPATAMAIAHRRIQTSRPGMVSAHGFLWVAASEPSASASGWAGGLETHAMSCNRHNLVPSDRMAFFTDGSTWNASAAAAIATGLGFTGALSADASGAPAEPRLQQQHAEPPRLLILQGVRRCWMAAALHRSGATRARASRTTGGAACTSTTASSATAGRWRSTRDPPAPPRATPPSREFFSTPSIPAYITGSRGSFRCLEPAFEDLRDCRSDYTDRCPDGWTAQSWNSRYCQAPSSYTGACNRVSDLGLYDDAQKVRAQLACTTGLHSRAVR